MMTPLTLFRRISLLFWLFLILTGIPAGPFSAVGAETEAAPVADEIDAVWSTSDGISMEIYYSSRKGGIWSEPARVSDDHYDNMYPVVDRDSSGRRWVFWTAYDNGKMELHYAILENGSWGSSETLAADLKTNIAPSVVIDKGDRVWVTWSANDGGYDDIWYAYYENGSWSGPARLHAENDSPDVLPVIELEGDGTPVVNWRMLVDGRYVAVSSRWDGSDWSETVQLPEKASDNTKESEEKNLELPSFLNKSGLVFLRVY